MARPTSTKRPVSRPGRILVLFLAAVVVLFAVLAAVDLTGGAGKDSIWKPRLGLDLQGGTRITLQARDDGKNPDATKLAEARGIIDQRVNATGVSEAEVTTQSSNQVVIEIPGERRGDIVDQVGKTAQLRFRLVWAQAQSSQKPLSDEDRAAALKTVKAADWSKVSLGQLIAAETQGLQTLPADYAKSLEALQSLLGGQVCGRDARSTEDVAELPLVTCDTESNTAQLLSPAVIEGTDVSSAAPELPQGQTSWVVAIGLKGQAVKTFDTVTEALYQQDQQGNSQKSQFAIVLDGQSISSPTTNGHFTNGKSQIQGNFTATSSKALADQLKYGALPLTFGVNGVSVEGPSLAGTQLQAGLIAGAVGLVLVIIYLLLYYRGLGLVAIGSLLIAGAVTYALVLVLSRGVGFTLTLPGIAGLIVAIGITADSFIVFFERIRDEVRDGKSLRLAVESGWTRARTTVLAADAVSFLAALILYIFAIGVVRGFAFALGLTTIIDVVVVFLFTKPLISVLARTRFFGQGHRLSGLDADHLGIDRRVDHSGPARRRPPSDPTTEGGQA